MYYEAEVNVSISDNRIRFPQISKTFWVFMMFLIDDVRDEKIHDKNSCKIC